jgi:hypothetical protein
MGGAVSFQP